MSLTELQEIVHEIQREFNLTPRQVFEAQELYVPLSIFADRRLGVLEALVKFMVENNGMSYNEIANILKRDNRTIWTTYHKAIKKSTSVFKELPGYMIPVNIFAERKMGVLEVLAKYCKVTLNMTNCEIAKIIKRDNRTIWCVVNK